MKTLTPFLIVFALCATTAISADDEATLNQAIKALNAHAKTDADKKLVLTAVSQQTKMPEKTLQSQMGTTHLGYGELLTADSLAQGSRKSLTDILALKQNKGWVALSREVKIDPNSLVARLRQAEKMVQGSQSQPKQAAKNTKKQNVAAPVPPPPAPMMQPTKGN